MLDWESKSFGSVPHGRLIEMTIQNIQHIIFRKIVKQWKGSQNIATKCYYSAWLYFDSDPALRIVIQGLGITTQK